MEITQVGSYHLADNPELYEVQRDNNFEFIVTGIDNIVRADAQPDGVDTTIPNASQTLRFSVVSSSIPMFSQESITIRRGNSVVKLAGVPTFSEGTLTINDYIGADGKSILMAWQNLSYNVRDDKIGNAKDYKKVCYLCEYTPDYSKLVRTWKLLGCWISGLSEGEYTMEQSGKKTIQATITFDRAYMELAE